MYRRLICGNGRYFHSQVLLIFVHLKLYNGMGVLGLLVHCFLRILDVSYP